MKLKAMTYNIYSGRDLARDLNLEHAASVIRAVQPDFVVLNEVRSHTEDVGPLSQADELGRLTGYYPIFGKAIDILGGEYGNAFLSRLPVASFEVIHIPDAERTGDYFYEHRCILRVVLLAEKQPFTVLATHFGLAPAEQELAVQTVLGLLAQEKNPVLLMGDLNAEPDAPVLQPLFDVLRDAAEGSGILTFPSGKPEIKIDHILYTKPFRAENVYSIDTQNSDHRPLIALLALDAREIHA